MIAIKLFKLDRMDSVLPDQFTQCVVAAATEKEARELANTESEDEGYVWTDGTLVEATELAPDCSDDVSGIILWSKE
jgi:hypothetical protein